MFVSKLKLLNMKKLFLLAFVAASFTLTSCKKDWTCECKEGSTVDFTYTQKSTKASAKTWCEAWNTTYKVSTPAGSCALK
jgi:hypothetical protein